MKYLITILIAATLTACGGGDHEENENEAKPAHQVTPIDCSASGVCT